MYYRLLFLPTNVKRPIAQIPTIQPAATRIFFSNTIFSGQIPEYRKGMYDNKEKNEMAIYKIRSLFSIRATNGAAVSKYHG